METQTLSEAFASLPANVQLWLNYINIISIAGLFFIRIREAQVLVLAFVLSMPVGAWMVSDLGIYHPLAGLSHVVFWLPAAIYVSLRIVRTSWQQYEGWYRRSGLVWAGTVVLTYLISNVWDVLNLLRFLFLDNPGARV